MRSIVYAYCWRSGVIGFSEKVPDGAIKFAEGRIGPLKNLIYRCARLAYDNENWLVPGVPEAEDEGDEKINALIRWVAWLSLRKLDDIKLL